MKISILLPTLYPALANRLITSLRLARLPKDASYEIVAIGPDPPTGCDIVSVKEASPSGNNPANRAAFSASTGDAILCLPDEAIVSPSVFEVATESLGSMPNNKVVAMDGGHWECFGKRYAPFPFTLRETIVNHWDFFYPYKSHWGDVAFSLDVWKKGGAVTRPSVETVIMGDRMGLPESPNKWPNFDGDYLRFQKDFAEMIVGCDLSNFQTFNHAVP